MKRILAGALLAVLLAAVAYFAGFWPEHQRLESTRAELARLQSELDAAASEVRAGRVLGLLLHLSDVAAAHNYGEASTLSSAFFDQVREEISRTGQARIKQALESVQQVRDRVTASLARSDPTVVDLLREQELAIRRALGYPVE
jgi:hypothetical protein